MKNFKMITMGALAITAALAAAPASAQHVGRSYFGGGAGVFEDVIRDYGRKVGEGARNAGSRASEVLDRVTPIVRGVSAVNQSRTLLKFGGPLPLIIMPKGYNPALPLGR